MRYNTKSSDLLKSSGMFNAFKDVENSITITYGAPVSSGVVGFIASDGKFYLHCRKQMDVSLQQLQNFVNSCEYEFTAKWNKTSV